MMGKKIKTSRQIREKDDKIQDFSKGMKFENKKWVALANKKMVNACLSIKIKALQKQKKKSAKKSKPKSKDQTGMDLMNNIENQFSVG